ncbi:class I SAM-dependent methyltransferase [bacterium]|nr:class I SAM-dependent methyltransferase [bacterium]
MNLSKYSYGLDVCRSLFHRLLAQIAPLHYLAGFWDELAATDPNQAILTGVTDDQEFLKSGRCSLGFLENHIVLDSTWHVLDYGCGTGRVTRFIAPKVRRVTAADISGTMLSLLKQETKHISTITAVRIRSRSLKELPDNEYDLIFSMLVLQHLNKTNASKTLFHLGHKLKTGGYMFLQFPSADYKRTFPELYDRMSETDASQPGLARLYYPHEIEMLLHDNQLCPLKFEYRDGDYYVSARKVVGPDALKPLPPPFQERYAADIAVMSGASSWPTGQKYSLTCRLRNIGNMSWRNDETDLVNYVQLGVSLAADDGHIIIRDFARQALPTVLGPDAEITLSITCPAITEKGRYFLLIDMVNERHFWFHDLAGTVCRHAVEVIS